MQRQHVSIHFWTRVCLSIEQNKGRLWWFCICWAAAKIEHHPYTSVHVYHPLLQILDNCILQLHTSHISSHLGQVCMQPHARHQLWIHSLWLGLHNQKNSQQRRKVCSVQQFKFCNVVFLIRNNCNKGYWGIIRNFKSNLTITITKLMAHCSYWTNYAFTSIQKWLRTKS